MSFAAQTTGYLRLLVLTMKKTLRTAMKTIKLNTMGSAKNSPQKATLKMLSSPKKSSFKYRQAKCRRSAHLATFLEFMAPRPWFRSISSTPCLLKMLPQLIGAVCAPPHVGGAAAAKPAPEIDNRFEEAGGKASPGPATKHAHTLPSPLRLTLGKDTKPTQHRRGS